MNKIAAGKLNEGVEDLEACVEAVPTDVWAMRILASSYFEKGNLDGTEEVVLRALEHEKNEPGLYLLLGQVYMGRGLAQKAKENLRLALDLDPQFAAAYVSLGTLASRTGDPLKAAEYFQRAIEMDPGSTGPTAYNALGMMYLGRMKPDEARESFNEALAIDELNGGAHNGLAMILIEEGKLEEATGELEIAARYMPNSVQVLSTLAALHNKRGEYEQGIQLARRALEVNDLFPQALNSLGSALLNTGDLAGAAEAFEKVLAQNAYYVPSMVNLGQVYLAQRREEKAVEMYEQALRVNPYQPLALFNIGTYKTTRGRPDEALAYYRRAIAADPDYAIAHQHLGMLLVMQGQAAEALPHLEKSLKLDADLLERERVAELVEGLRAAADPTMQPNALPAAPGEPQSR
jgi:tetratricopeptide (TPR) repeat protein